MEVECLTKYGRPVVRIKGRPITNLIRLLLNTHELRIRRDPTTEGGEDE